MPQIPTTAAHLALVASRTRKNLSLDEVGAVIDAINALGAADDTLARTGNTARDQEMYAAGRAVGEENAKHNAAIRGGADWLPIESAPKDGQSILGRGPRQDTVVMAWNEWAQPESRWEAVHLDVNGYGCPEIVLRGEPTLWQPMPMPPCPTCNDQGAVGNILTAQPCHDCAAPASPVSTVEDAVDEQTAFERWYDRTCPSGDVEAVQRQWEASSDYADFHAPAAGDARDAERLDWLEQHDGRFYNKDRISSIVGTGFLVAGDEHGVRHQTVRAAIDAAIAAQRQGDA